MWVQREGGKDHHYRVPIRSAGGQDRGTDDGRIFGLSFTTPSFFVSRLHGVLVGPLDRHRQQWVLVPGPPRHPLSRKNDV